MGEKRSNHTVYNVNYHFVWCPKYRHAILEPIEESLEASFRDVCDGYGYEILSLHISPDHLHLFPEARTERDCANGQEHHGAGDVGTARTVLGGVSVGWWFLGGIILRWDGGDVSTDTIEQYIERTEHV